MAIASAITFALYWLLQIPEGKRKSEKSLVFLIIYSMTEAYSEPCRTSKMELFVKIVANSRYSFFMEISILDVWLGSEHASELVSYYFISISWYIY